MQQNARKTENVCNIFPVPVVVAERMGEGSWGKGVSRTHVFMVKQTNFLGICLTVPLPNKIILMETDEVCRMNLPGVVSMLCHR